MRKPLVPDAVANFNWDFGAISKPAGTVLEATQNAA